MQLYTDGFDAPVGWSRDRVFGSLWPLDWFDATPFGKAFTPNGFDKVVLHTGADLNRPFDTDAHTGVFVVANGLVRYAFSTANKFGSTVVVQHALDASTVVYSRYEHLESCLVRVGQTVMRGEQLGTIGNAHGIYGYHLHFDIAKTALLARDPHDYVLDGQPDKLKLNYVDPKTFLSSHRPGPAGRYQATDDLLIRKSPYGLRIGSLVKGQTVTVQGVTKLSWTNISFGRLIDSEGNTLGYSAMQYLRAL